MSDVAPYAERLQMRHVTRRFGDVVALDDVEFSARAGEIHALLGENGAGKSTLMQILAGLYRLQEGEIRLDGRPVRIDSPRDAAAHGIAMVHQHFTLVEPFTVAQNLALAVGDVRPTTNGAPAATAAMAAARGKRPMEDRDRWSFSPRRRHDHRCRGGARGRRGGPVGRWSGYDPRRAAAPALAVAERLGWPLDANARVGSLPVGAQQRVEILKALSREARLLIFDEPTAVLAPLEVEELFALLRRLRSEGRTLIFISHKLNEVMALCDRVTVLRRGRRVATLLVAETDPRALAALMVGDLPLPLPPPRSGEGDENRRSLNAASTFSPPRPPLRLGEGAGGGVGLELDAVTVPGPGRPAVESLSLSVKRGEIFGLAGVDGNGQVELAEAVWGLRPIAAGTIRLDGQSLTPAVSGMLARSPRSLDRTRKIGWIPQDRHRSGLVLAMSVRENLVLLAHGWPEYRRGPFLRMRALSRLADRLVQKFDIRVADPGQPAASLSGGNQQKIVIARALFDEPDLLVAVNPTRGLDIGATGYVHDQLRQARARGAAILLISTELEEVLTLSDRVGVLYEGRLMGVLPPDAPREELGLLMGGRSPETVQRGDGVRQ